MSPLGRNVFLISANYPVRGARQVSILVTHLGQGWMVCFDIWLMCYLCYGNYQLDKARYMLMDKKLWNITLNFPWQVMRYWPLQAESLVVEESLMMNDWCQPLSSGSGASLGPHTLHSSVSLGLAADTMGWGHWGLNQSQPLPIPHCEISTNQDSRFYSRRERCYWPVLTFLREKTLMKCLTCLGTGRIHSIQALCIRWCHCKWRQHLQLTRKIKPQKLEQLLSKCLNPGKVTSNREQNLTQSFRLKVFISSHSNRAVSYLECWYNKV